LEVKNYIPEVARTCAVEVISETKSTGGEPRVFQNHHFNNAAFQGSSVFQERLKSGTREFVGYMQIVNSNINKDGSVYFSHDPQKTQTNSLNFNTSYIGIDNVYNLGLLEENLLIAKIKTQIM
jgi:hypothetical protein